MDNDRFIIEVLDENNWQIEDTSTGEFANPVDGTTNVLKGLVKSINKFYNESEELKKENEQLKTQINIFEKFLDENNLDIDWEIFCTVDKCKKDSDDYGCKECKYLGDVE